MNAHHRRPVGWRWIPPANRAITANPKSAGGFSNRTPLHAKPAAKARTDDRLQPSHPHQSKRLQLIKVPSSMASRPWRAIGNSVISTTPASRADRSCPCPPRFRRSSTIRGIARLEVRAGNSLTTLSCSPWLRMSWPIGQCRPGGLLRYDRSHFIGSTPVVDRATVATRPSSQSRSGRLPRPGSQRQRVMIHRRTGVNQRRPCCGRFISWTLPLVFKSPDRSDVVASSDLRVLDTTECIAGAQQST